MTDTVDHADLTGAALHEPKGADSASTGQVYVANGSGSGAWTSLGVPTGNFRVITQSFTTSGTWTKPANFIGLEYTMVSPGGNLIGSFGDDPAPTIIFKGVTVTGPGKQVSGGSATGGDENYLGNAYTSSYLPGYPALIIGQYGFGFNSGSGPFSGGSAAKGWKRDSDLSSTESVTFANAAGNVSANNGVVILKQYVKI